jgi:transcriptional regulator with XRE-family HTH domain
MLLTLDRSYIASVENGQRNISIVNIEKIATALGVTLKEFFNNVEFDNAIQNALNDNFKVLIESSN